MKNKSMLIININMYIFFRKRSKFVTLRFALYMRTRNLMYEIEDTFLSNFFNRYAFSKIHLFTNIKGLQFVIYGKHDLYISKKQIIIIVDKL